MTVAGTRHPLRNARFDPRMVIAGFVVLALGVATLGLTTERAGSKADEVAAPVAVLCQEGGTTGARLAQSGACSAAANVQQGTGPFRSEVQVGADGKPGAPGQPGVPGASQPGAPGQPGTSGTPGAIGQAGINGVDGVSPACLAEPDLCRGVNGIDGINGVNGASGLPGKAGEPGAPGAPGRDGMNGTDGRGIVATEQDPDDPCTRIVRYSDSTMERWNTCSPSTAPEAVG